MKRDTLHRQHLANGKRIVLKRGYGRHMEEDSKKGNVSKTGLLCMSIARGKLSLKNHLQTVLRITRTKNQVEIHE